jgi:hypothetical protein
MIDRADDATTPPHVPKKPAVSTGAGAHKALSRCGYDKLVNAGNFDALTAIFLADSVDHTQPPNWPVDCACLRP